MRFNWSLIYTSTTLELSARVYCFGMFIDQLFYWTCSRYTNTEKKTAFAFIIIIIILFFLFFIIISDSQQADGRIVYTLWCVFYYFPSANNIFTRHPAPIFKCSTFSESITSQVGRLFFDYRYSYLNIWQKTVQFMVTLFSILYYIS